MEFKDFPGGRKFWRIGRLRFPCFGFLHQLPFWLLLLMEPGIIAQLMAGEAEGQKVGPRLILFFAILMLVPMLMAFLSLTLKNPINRWVNLIVGIIFTVVWLSGIVDAVQSAYWGGALMTLSAVTASVLIIWYAWKSERSLNLLDK